MTCVGWLVKQVPVPHQYDKKQASEERSLCFLRCVVEPAIKASPDAMTENSNTNEPAGQMEMDDG